MTDPNAKPKPRLREIGQVYVTLAAAESYAESESLRIEEARRELTEIALDAYVTGDGALESGRATNCRARPKQQAVDLSLTVVQEGRLLVVVAVSARDLNESPGAAKRRIVR